MYRIALMNASNKYLNRRSSSLTLCYLKTYAETHIDIPVNIRMFEFDDVQDMIDFSPHLLGISSTTPTFNNAIEIAQKARRSIETVIVLGGYHITFLPEEINRDCFDIGVLGEGEKTFTELIIALSNNFPIKNIHGIVYKESSRTIITPKRETLSANDIVIPTSGRFINDGFTDIFSSRGCFYNCRFCSSTKFWTKYNFLTPEAVVNEIRWNYETLGSSHIVFLDDLFIHPEERLHSIINLLDREGLLSKITFSGHIRANLMKPSIFEALKRMNFASIQFGAESGSNRILKVYKPGASVEINQRCIDMSVSYGFPIHAYIICGFPGETSEDLLLTAKFIERNIDCCSFQISLFQPYPGTDAWDSLSENVRHDIIENQKWEQMGLDFRVSGFDLNNALYFNEDIPRNQFMELIKANFQKYLQFPEHLSTIYVRMNKIGKITEHEHKWYKKMIWYIEQIENICNAGDSMLLYGAGSDGKGLINCLPQTLCLRLGGIIDIHYETLPAKIGLVPVYPPSAALRDENEKILITSINYKNEIYSQLLSMGVQKHRIIALPEQFNCL
jgi:radical SAM superfamily enzyme YgiQ (UPF0313 family)